MSTATARPLGRGRRAPAAAAGVAVLVLALVAGGVDRIGGAGGLPDLAALPQVLRATAACLVLFTLCGYAAARTTLPRHLEADVPLLVLPLGAVTSALALTLLGFFWLPFAANLGLVLLAGAGSAVAARVRLGPLVPGEDRAGRRSRGLAFVAAGVIVAVALSPLFQAGVFATVMGQNGDAHLATGSAELLQHAYPTATAPELPVDRMPGAWRSKYPIYYALAAVSALAGLDPIQAFATLSAFLVGLMALGFYLVARRLLEASSSTAVAAMAFVGISEQTLHVALHPFFNQLWGTFALPFTLLAGWLFCRHPGRGTLALLLGFGAIGSLAYPLLAPFTGLYLALAGAVVWRRCRREGRRPGWLSALRLPRDRRWLALWVPLGLLLGLLALGLTMAGAAKVSGGVAAALPGGDLRPWSVDDLSLLEIDEALGVSVLPLVVVPVLGAALYALLRRPREQVLPLAGMVVALLSAAAYMRVRTGGELFVLKALSFGGVLVSALGAVGLTELTRSTRRPWARIGTAALAVTALAILLGARAETTSTTPHVSREVWDLREWSDAIPADASVRVDVTPAGVQQWAAYLLADHPVTASRPRREFFPYPPIGRKADYLVVDRAPPAPADAAGSSLRANRSFALYRMRADVAGPDLSSRLMIDPFRPEDRRRPGAG